MALTLTDVSNVNKGPTTVRPIHNDQSNVMICYNPVLKRERNGIYKVYRSLGIDATDNVNAYRRIFDFKASMIPQAICIL